MNAKGDVHFVRNNYHCAVYSILDVQYDDFQLNSRTTISGSGTVRLIFTSYACKYFKNIHADIRMQGAFTSRDQTVEELSTTIDYEPMKEQWEGLTVISATVATDSVPFQCADHDGQTVCIRSENSGPLNYCASEEDICDVSWAGHQSCMRPEYEETDAHCNLGCCAPQPWWKNTCNLRELEGRECDPALEPFFTTSYLLWGTNLMTYEVPIRCSEDGLWTLPCSAEFDACPLGSRCYYPQENDWGPGFEDYGYCSCTVGH